MTHPPQGQAQGQANRVGPGRAAGAKDLMGRVGSRKSLELWRFGAKRVLGLKGGV
ncbi:MAG: hypothetical protein LBF38_08225 [Deltaproteobacteria bacterium]|nr:hypothetical protein [Deltaproteobacteria bacterium]